MQYICLYKENCTSKYTQIQLCSAQSNQVFWIWRLKFSDKKKVIQQAKI